MRNLLGWYEVCVMLPQELMLNWRGESLQLVTTLCERERKLQNKRTLGPDMRGMGRSEGRWEVARRSAL